MRLKGEGGGKQIQTVICEQYVYYLNTGAICKRND